MPSGGGPRAIEGGQAGQRMTRLTFLGGQSNAHKMARIGIADSR